MTERRRVFFGTISNSSSRPFICGQKYHVSKLTVNISAVVASTLLWLQKKVCDRISDFLICWCDLSFSHTHSSFHTFSFSYIYLFCFCIFYFVPAPAKFSLKFKFRLVKTLKIFLFCLVDFKNKMIFNYLQIMFFFCFFKTIQNLNCVWITFVILKN